MHRQVSYSDNSKSSFGACCVRLELDILLRNNYSNRSTEKSRANFRTNNARGIPLAHEDTCGSLDNVQLISAQRAVRRPLFFGSFIDNCEQKLS